MVIEYQIVTLVAIELKSGGECSFYARHVMPGICLKLDNFNNNVERINSLPWPSDNVQ